MNINIEQYSYYESPIGQILLAGNDDVLLLLGFPNGKMWRHNEPNWQYSPHAYSNCKQQLNAYFAKEKFEFDIKYHINGSDFQQRVLKKVAKIPYGKTASYADIAQKIQQPNAVRAVGGANARNPLPIIIPCHRVIGKNGQLTGFGGGIETKRFLLEMEGIEVAL